jgi:ABC-type Mn2+/Zn2+ transport system ATPase subunit
LQDIPQIDYLPEENKIKINLPTKVFETVNIIEITKLGKTEIILEHINKNDTKEALND